MIRYYFGAPGAGKTTMATKEILLYYKRGFWTFANFDCSAADKDCVDLKDLGQWSFPENSYIAIDEAGIDYNNRRWKSFSHEAIKWYKKHRHYLGDLGLVSVFSQGWDDVDKTIRTLTAEYYYLKKIGFFTLKRRLLKDIKCNKDTDYEPRDCFEFVSMWYLILKPIYYVSFLFGIGFVIRFLFPTVDRRFHDIELIFRPKYYKYFDTYEREYLPCPFDLDELAEARKFRAAQKSFSNRIKGILRCCADRLRGIFKRW